MSGSAWGLLWRVQLFEEAYPPLGVKIEDVHIVELLGDFEDTAINDHPLVVVNLGGVTTSGNWFIHGLDHGPLLRGKIKFPSVAELVIFIILTTENIHAISVNAVDLDASGVTSSWTWDAIWLADSWDFLPSATLEVVSVDVIGSLSKCETTENYH